MKLKLEIKIFNWLNWQKFHLIPLEFHHQTYKHVAFDNTCLINSFIWSQKANMDEAVLENSDLPSDSLGIYYILIIVGWSE